MESNNEVKMQDWFCNVLFPEMLKCEQEIQNGFKSTKHDVEPHNRKKSKSHKKSKRVKNKSKTCESDNIVSVDDVECPEYVTFCEKSKKHQEKLGLIRQRREELEQEYVLDTVGPAGELKPNVVPPTEPPGQQRELELQEIYGKRANVIHAMEVKLQSQFDLNLDTFRPHYWPIIPLKL